MKNRLRKAERNEKANTLYRLRQSTTAEKLKRCVPLRRNVAEKPRDEVEVGTFPVTHVYT